MNDVWRSIMAAVTSTTDLRWGTEEEPAWESELAEMYKGMTFVIAALSISMKL